jgi:hypothetical protein
LPWQHARAECDIRRNDDPYDRLATLLWLLKPSDVAELAAVADFLAELRLATLEDGVAP